MPCGRCLDAWRMSRVRLTVLGIWLVCVAATPYPDYAEFSPATFTGRGMAKLWLESDWLVEVLCEPRTLTVLKWSTVGLLAVSMLLTRAARIVMPFATMGVVVLDSLTKALGAFANHARVVPLLLLCIFAIFSRIKWRSLTDMCRASLQKRRCDCVVHSRYLVTRYAQIAALVGMVVVLPYAYIGLTRLLTGGTDMFTGEVLRDYLRAASLGFSVYPGWLQAAVGSPSLNAGFCATTIGEAAAPLLLLYPRLRVWWLLMMGLFQIVTLVCMNILFWENMIICAVLFWPDRVSRPVFGKSTRHSV